MAKVEQSACWLGNPLITKKLWVDYRVTAKEQTNRRTKMARYSAKVTEGGSDGQRSSQSEIAAKEKGNQRVVRALNGA